MDVTRTGEHSLRQDQIDQPHHRPLRRLLGRDGEDIGLVLRGLEFRNLGLRPHPLEEPVDHSTLVVALVEFLLDRRRTGQEHPDLTARGEGQHLFAVEVQRVRRGDLEERVGGVQGKNVIPPGNVLGDDFHASRVAVRQVGQLQADPRGQGTHQRLVGRRFVGNSRLPEGARRILARAKLIELVGPNERLDGGGEPFVAELGIGQSGTPRFAD